MINFHGSLINVCTFDPIQLQKMPVENWAWGYAVLDYGSEKSVTKYVFLKEVDLQYHISNVVGLDSEKCVLLQSQRIIILKSLPQDYQVISV